MGAKVAQLTTRDIKQVSVSCWGKAEEAPGTLADREGVCRLGPRVKQEGGGSMGHSRRAMGIPGFLEGQWAQQEEGCAETPIQGSWGPYLATELG